MMNSTIDLEAAGAQHYRIFAVLSGGEIKQTDVIDFVDGVEAVCVFCAISGLVQGDL